MAIIASKERTSLAIRKSTKIKLDEMKSPGQSYDGFIGQLLDFWQNSPKARISYLANIFKARK